MRLLVRPCAVHKRFDGIALHWHGLAAPVKHGRRRERPFALDLVCARLDLCSAARDDKDIRHAKRAKVAYAIDVAVADKFFFRKHAVVVAEGVERLLCGLYLIE